MTVVYNFTVKKVDGEQKNLSDFTGKPLLIVNTASKCGFTPQFKELQAMYEKYNHQGFEILGFPCDQFNNQEFADIDETMQFCQKNYGVNFPMFAKVDVKGDNADPLFKHLVSEKKGLLTEGIKWNFTKFLINKEGKVVARYAPQTSPTKIENDLKSVLK
ncbi:glutathione peroxidase [Viridibacillus sp. FSL R5-0477]|uniref:Glutathione peroxidase n=1 Tax=Viridibacillus arenosi FSL R5-213 TaxID=1227360 RepID=W4F3N3_9BACL|nr:MULTISPECIES: glutathione peroxidase [Viridibacillus]ETT86927.1 glutathione peroxidase [Viridibacillus arenosi FSL R5-213]OMC77740.1 glutathione peroxidase [Viridibacillus sp. FSL H8-0123]OMC81556.1 glutathione peroxidase [Viridibacillus sp. FSL H7-0596]OMC87067.1 glutathione peroxidase [Viridibacillus arenosi]